MPNVKTNNNFQVIINGKDYTKQTVFPIKWSKLLDERLDETRLSVKRIRQKIFQPLTPATITMTDKKGRQIELNTVVTTDQSAEVPVGNNTFDHEIMCLEETKILEGIIVDALTFTNDLGRTYTLNSPLATPVKTFIPDYYNGLPSPINEPKAISAYSQSELSNTEHYFPSVSAVFNWELNHFEIILNYMIIRHNKVEIERISDVYKQDGKTYPGRTPINLKLKEGTYEVEYYIDLGFGKGTKAIYTFNAVYNKLPLEKWNISSVIDRVLNLCEPHLAGVAPRFKLNDTQHAEFSEIEAPEFAFTNCTLKEVLDQIGGYIHGVPRLKGSTIYFDMLGGTKQAKVASPIYPYISNMYSQDIENYCSALDSTVDNLVCLTDPAQGTITEPYVDGYKTTRTETVYAQVKDNNMIIPTQYPIQEIKEVKCGYIPGTSIKGGDITSYVFEQAEYNRMSSYTAIYPTSRVYALYYTQGSKNIEGLFFKQQKLNDVLGDYAILKILKETTGENLSALGVNYPGLAFQVSYIPVFSARVQQTKQYIGDFKEPRTLCYNQGANIVETRHYGENMKGAVARMGNVDRVVTYNLGDFSLIPEIGEMYSDEYYIAGVTCELYPTLIKCMLTLSQDFNRLSEYIGINSVRRFYEVSEKAAYRRDIKYADYLVIGDKVESDDTLMRNIRPLALALKGGSSPGLFNLYGISNVIAQGYDESGGELTTVNLPVVATAQGNAMVFTFSYEDNYSAGTQAQSESEESVSGYFTNAVAYCDYYGRIKTLKFSMKSQTESPASETEQRKIGKLLPATTEDVDDTATIRTVGDGLYVDKDGREILSVNYVLEFVTNKRNYVIGSAFARRSGLVSTLNLDFDDQARLYVLPDRISKFAEKVDISNATHIYDFYATGAPNHITITTKQLKFEDFTSPVDGQAWAVVSKKGGFLFGSNEPIASGQTVTMPYITLKHDIFNLQGGK